MSMVGISPDEVNQGFSEQIGQIEVFRTVRSTISNHIESLAHSTYVSAATAAAQVKWESEVGPKLDGLIAEMEAKNQGGAKCVAIQQANQDAGASDVMGI